MKVFVYGTLKRGHGNNTIMELAEARYLKTTLTQDKYFLVVHGIPYVVNQKRYSPNLEKYRGYIKGEVYEVNKKNIGIIDNLEGHPHWYQRRKIKTQDNETVWLYFMDMNVEHEKEALVLPEQGILEYRR